VQSNKNLKYILDYIQQFITGVAKQKYLNWLFCHYEVLVVIAIVGMLALKVVYTNIDPWT
jgi:hypothetical protein